MLVGDQNGSLPDLAGSGHRLEIEWLVNDQFALNLTANIYALYMTSGNTRNECVDSTLVNYRLAELSILS